MKLFLTILFSFLFFLNYATAQNYFLEISNESVHQGEILIIKLSLKENLSILNAFWGQEKINFLKINENDFVSFLGIKAKQKPGNYKLKIELSNNEKIEKIIKINEKKFPITRLIITKEKEEQGLNSKKIINNLNEENKIINEVTKKITNQIYFQEPFIYPLEKIKIVGNYGNIRKNKNDEIQHLGVDFDGGKGDNVYAINKGKIVLAKNFTIYGNTIILDHGRGIYSLYLHLDKFFVQENQIIEKGQKIGEIGNTGYSLQPHLHLSIKVNNQSVDPLIFFSKINKFINENLKNKTLNQNFSNFNSKIEIYDLTQKINFGFEKTNQRKIDTIIIHSSYNPFNNDYYNISKIIEIYKNYNVAAHYLIDRQGNIYKLIDENNIAYHAGKGKMPDNRTKINYFSIGIEIIYHKNETPNAIQYQKLNHLIKDIKTRHNIKYILGHNDIAPERKDDPWNFDWQKIEQ